MRRISKFALGDYVFVRNEKIKAQVVSIFKDNGEYWYEIKPVDFTGVPTREVREDDLHL
jgi:hypothetical protein